MDLARLKIKREMYSSDDGSEDSDEYSSVKIEELTSVVKMEEPTNDSNDPMPENAVEDVNKPKKKTSNRKRRMITCIDCNELKPHKAKQMCFSCYERTKKLDDNKKKQCVECNKSKAIVARRMCKNCYHRIFTTPKQVVKRRAKRLAAKNDPLRNHKPKPIPKIELQSESEDDFEQSKDVSSDDEDVDSKIGIKMEIKCEPSTSK